MPTWCHPITGCNMKEYVKQTQAQTECEARSRRLVGRTVSAKPAPTSQRVSLHQSFLWLRWVVAFAAHKTQDSSSTILAGFTGGIADSPRWCRRPHGRRPENVLRLVPQTELASHGPQPASVAACSRSQSRPAAGLSRGPQPVAGELQPAAGLRIATRFIILTGG